jgi:hypothetical protein
VPVKVRQALEADAEGLPAHLERVLVVLVNHPSPVAIVRHP